MDTSTTQNHQRVRPKLTQQVQTTDVLSENLTLQTSFYSRQFHHFSQIVTHFKVEYQGMLGQRELLKTAQQTIFTQIDTIREKISGLAIPLKYRESTTQASSRLQSIGQAQKQIKLLSVELAHLNARDIDLTNRIGIVSSHILNAMQAQEEARFQVLHHENLYRTRHRELQKSEQVPKDFTQTVTTNPAQGSAVNQLVNLSSAAGTATPSPQRAMDSADRPTPETIATTATLTAQNGSNRKRARVTRQRATRRKASPSDGSSLASKLEDLFNQSQKKGYKPIYTPLMLAVKRVLDVDEPAALHIATTSLIEELRKEGPLYKFSDEDISSFLVKGLKTKRIGLGLKSDFSRLYAAKLQKFKVFEQSLIETYPNNQARQNQKLRGKKQSIIFFLLGHDRLDLLPYELERILIGRALSRYKSKSLHVDPNDSDDFSKKKILSLLSNLIRDLKNRFTLSLKEGYQPVIPRGLQEVARAANAYTSEEVSTADPSLEEQVGSLSLLTKKNMTPERLKLLAPGLRKIKQQHVKNPKAFFKLYKDKIKGLENLNLQLKQAPSKQDYKNLYAQARRAQALLFQLLLIYDRLDLITNNIDLLKLFLNYVVYKEAHHAETQRRKELKKTPKMRKACTTTSE